MYQEALGPGDSGRTSKLAQLHKAILKILDDYQVCITALCPRLMLSLHVICDRQLTR